MLSKKVNHQWPRVFGSDIQPQHAERAKANTRTLTNPYFIECCKRADIEPTRRQAIKFNRKTGIAFNNREITQ